MNYYVISLPLGLRKAAQHAATISADARAAGHPPGPAGRRSASSPRSSADGSRIIIETDDVTQLKGTYRIVAGPMTIEQILIYLHTNEANWKTDVQP